MKENEIKEFASALVRKTQFGISAVIVTSCDKYCTAVKNKELCGDNRARKSNNPLWGRVQKVACYTGITFARYGSCVNGALQRSGSTETYTADNHKCHFTHLEGWEGIIGVSKSDPSVKYLLYTAPKKMVGIKVAYLLDGNPISKGELEEMGMVFTDYHKKPSTQANVVDAEEIITQTFSIENVHSLHLTHEAALEEWMGVARL